MAVGKELMEPPVPEVRVLVMAARPMPETAQMPLRTAVVVVVVVDLTTSQLQREAVRAVVADRALSSFDI